MYCFICYSKLYNYNNNINYCTYYSKQVCSYCNTLYKKYKKNSYFLERRIQLQENITHLYLY